MRVQQNPIGITSLSLSQTNLVAWYDISDADTLFADAGGGVKATHGGIVSNITNKAYDGLGASSTSLNTAIINNTGTSSYSPVLAQSTEYGESFLTFDGSNWLYSTRVLGNVSSGKMGGVTLNQENFCFSFVIQNTDTTETIDHFYFAWQDSSRIASSVGIEESDDQMYYWPKVTLSAVDSGTSFSGQKEFWTVVGGEASTSGADVRQIKIYKDGTLVHTSTTDFSGENRDLTANNANVNFYFGRNLGSTNQFVGRFYEFLQWDRALSDVQLDQLNTYYGVKYGIS